ncbi:unnamed protein product [Ambrosiozyma monospora]|uniref:Unnamed protein product n=1 Tax=Ambrosiozyma monospora TaxID=43982 RepID=A0A9W6YLH3_AMBMO|nr:unnamed protein product [Ambrosiozyma monospora]
MILSSFVQEVTQQLPPEIQCTIIKLMIHNYLRNTGFEPTLGETSKLSEFNELSIEPLIESNSLQFHKPVHYLTSFIGVEPLLDNIMSSLIQELVFDPSAFQSNQLQKFVNFVLARPIKIRLKATSAFDVDQDVLSDLLCQRYGEYIADYERTNFPLNSNYLNFATVVNCALHLLSNFFETTIFMPLSHLKCLKISVTSSSIEILKESLLLRLLHWRDAWGKCRRVVLSFSLDYTTGRVSSSSTFVSKLKDLNEFFEIEYDGSFFANPLCLESIESDSKKKTLLDLLKLKNPLDDSKLEHLVQICESIDEELVRIESDEPPYIQGRNISVVTHTGKSTSFVSIEMGDILCNFYCGKIHSLKELTLHSCFTTYRCLDSLPPGLLELSIMMKVYTKPCDIRLPVHLRILKTVGSIHYNIIENVTNADQLHELTYFELTLISDDSVVAPPDEAIYISKLKSFIHTVSPSLKYLFLSKTFLIPEHYQNKRCFAEQLSLSTIDGLRDLSFSANSHNCDFSLSLLPSCQRLQFEAYTTLSGQFPETLETLEVNLKKYGKSFEHFWDEYITPLKSLYCLKLSIGGETREIDFTNLLFPPNLYSLQLVKDSGKCDFVFDQLPALLMEALISCPDSPNDDKSVIKFLNVDTDRFKIVKDIFYLLPATKFLLVNGEGYDLMS